MAATRSRELFTLTVLVLALGLAVGSALLFDVSMALGAFLAGMIVGRSDYSLRAASEALPMRDAFAVLFFVSVGMLLDPQHILEAPGLIALTLAVILLGKPLAALFMIRLLRYPAAVALSVAVALAQIGEFSFILASMGREVGILPAAATQTVVAASIVSIVLNPLAYRAIPSIERWLARRPRLWRLVSPPPAPTGEALPARPSSHLDPGHRAIVVGYGPTGRTVTRLLRENGIEPTVIELNVDTLRELRENGVRAVYGDATQSETLAGAGVAQAGSLILTSDGMAQTQEVIRAAREMNPHVHVLARTPYLRSVAALYNAGANGVFSGEGEVALALTEALLRRLGATPDQIDRERDRLNSELGIGNAAFGNSEFRKPGIRD